MQRTHRAASALLSAASFADLSNDVSGSAAESVQKILSSVRHHLDMDVAFVAEFVGRRRYFRYVDSKAASPISVGDSLSLSDGYCQRVVEGLLPELIVDTATVPLAAALPETHAVPIGSHLSVPIRLKSGRVYGTFCCFNFQTDPSLDQRDLSVMRAFAEVAAHQIDHELETSATRNEQTRRVLSAIDRNQPTAVYQPVVSLADRSVVGIECLARFDGDPTRGPARWFADAADIGHGTTLELQAVRNALRGLESIALDTSLDVWLNLSARSVLDGGVIDRLGSFDPGRIVLELSEHEHVDDYVVLNGALNPLRERGVRIAIDDAGAGYASMSHILNLEPDFIKLDPSLTRSIEVDGQRRALAETLIAFGKQIGARIVAEGVESGAELAALRRLGVPMAQGYLLGAPVAVDVLWGTLATFGER